MPAVRCKRTKGGGGSPRPSFASGGPSALESARAAAGLCLLGAVIGLACQGGAAGAGGAANDADSADSADGAETPRIAEQPATATATNVEDAMPETPGAGGADAGAGGADAVPGGEDAAPGGEDAAPGGEDAPGVPSDSLRVDVVVPAEVRAGEPVPITLRLENLTDNPLNLYLTGRTIAFDLIVEDEAGAVAWRRLYDQVVPAILRVETLAAHATLELADTWDQRSNDGSAVGPGAYTVRGEVMTEAEPLEAAPVPLRIGGN